MDFEMTEIKFLPGQRAAVFFKHASAPVGEPFALDDKPVIEVNVVQRWTPAITLAELEAAGRAELAKFIRNE